MERFSFNLNNMDFSNIDFSATVQTETDESYFSKPVDDTAGFYFDEGIDTAGMNITRPNHSFDSDLFSGLSSTMDNTIVNGSWSQLSSATTLDNFTTPHTPSLDSLFPPQYANNNSKRPLQLDTQDFPRAKRHEGTDFAAFSPFVAPSAAPSLSETASSWGFGTQSTPSSESQVLGLTDEAADVCAMWFSKYAILPGDRHIESLSQLTGEPAAAIRQWFGLMLKQGMAGHDSAYKSQTRLSQPEQQTTSNDFNTITSQVIAPAHCSHDSTTTQASTSQPVLRGGKKGCTPTTRYELLCRDPNKIYQCTRKCGKRYGRKCDWKRNEEEGYPSKSWICSLCKNEGVEKVKPCFRKYHFSQHFRNIHPGVNSDDYEADSVVHTDTAFPRKCGFCTHRFSSRQDRIDHIAEHFKRGKCMLEWNNDEDESHDSDNMDDDDDDEKPDSDRQDENSCSDNHQTKDAYGHPDSSQDGDKDSGSGSGGQRFQPTDFTQFQVAPSSRPCAEPPRGYCDQATYERSPVGPPDGDLGSRSAGSNDGALQHIKPITAPFQRDTQTKRGDKDAVARDGLSGTLIPSLNQGKEKLFEGQLPLLDEQTEAKYDSAPLCSITKEKHSTPNGAMLIPASEPPILPPTPVKDVDLPCPVEKSRQPHVGTLETNINHAEAAAGVHALVTALLTLKKNAAPQGDSRTEIGCRSPTLSSHSSTDPLMYGIQESPMPIYQNKLLKGCPTNSYGQRSQYDSLDEGSSADVEPEPVAEPYLQASSTLKQSSEGLNSHEAFRKPLFIHKRAYPDTSSTEVCLSSFKESCNKLGLASMNRESDRAANYDARSYLSSKKSSSEAKPTLTMESVVDSVDDGGIRIDAPVSKLASFLSVKLLGAGGFGTVDEVVHRTTNLRIVRKTLKSRSHSAIQELKKEIGVLQKLRHPHIIRFLGAYSQGDKVSMLVSPVAEGTLAVWLDGLKVQKPTDLAAIIVKMYGCLASSVRYLHEQRPIIKHMDIKPQNILIVQGERECPHVILCDFGISSAEEPSEIHSLSKALTRRYCAPEVSRGVSREQAADIWSLGCVFLEMAIAAFSDDKPLWTQFSQDFCGCNGKYYWQDIPRLQTWLSDFLLQAKTFREASVLHTVKSMLHSEPSERPDAAQLTLIFTPGPCCLGWANENASFPSPAEELHQVEMLSQKGTVDCLVAPQLSGDALGKKEHEHFARAKAWLRECSHMHEYCRRQTHEKHTLPTRLLEIQQHDGKDPYVRVINSENIPHVHDGIEYVVINHLWGPSDVTLSTDVLHDDQGKLPREKLPQAVNDAICAAEHIGYHYAWLDSLCILQDSEEDKLRECANMASVYRNADLTIVVDEAQASKTSDKEFATPGENVTAASFGSAATLSLFDYQSPGFGWDTRAWSLQERLLSHRVLHLADEQLYWECNALKASETFPHGLPSLVWEKVHTKPSTTSSPSPTTPLLPEPKTRDAQFINRGDDGIKPSESIPSNDSGTSKDEEGMRTVNRSISDDMSPADAPRPLAYATGIKSSFTFGSDAYCGFDFAPELVLSTFLETKVESFEGKKRGDSDDNMEVQESVDGKGQADVVSDLAMDLGMGGV